MKPAAPPFGLGKASVRLALMLSLALLPLGLISIAQSWRLIDQSKALAERALLGEVLRAAAARRSQLLNTAEEARALEPLLRQSLATGQSCEMLLSLMVSSSTDVQQAQFVTPDGRLACASATPKLPTGSPEPAPKRPGAQIVPGPDGAGRIELTEPLFVPESGQFLGALRLTIVPFDPALLTATLYSDGPLEVFEVTREGKRLAVADAELAGDPSGLHLPEGADLGQIAEMASQSPRSFLAEGEDGRERIYAFVPILPQGLVLGGIWRPQTLFGDRRPPLLVLGVVFPLLMWVSSVGIAFFALRNQVLGPVALLRRRMQAFTGGDRDLPPARMQRAPDELQEISDSLSAMMRRIAADETRLAKSVHDQEVLLKEVHHRVKNNLQLIASILSMQVRQSEDPAVPELLRPIQDRVLGLATVYRHLYQTTTLSEVRADQLLEELINRQLAGSAGRDQRIETDVTLEPIELYPDQMVPLALLAGEALTNALAHIGRPEDGRARLSVSLLAPDGEDDRATFSLSHSRGEHLRAAHSVGGLGLGAQLVRAFSQQLEADLEEEVSPNEFSLTVRFPIAQFTHAEEELPDAPLAPEAVAP